MAVGSLDRYLDKQVSSWGTKASEADAIRDLVGGKIDAEEAARLFTAHVQASRNKEDAAARLWGLWQLLAGVVRDYFEIHDKLVAMMVAISRLPAVQAQGETLITWSEFPRMHDAWVEYVFYRDRLAHSKEDQSAIAFTARLCALRVLGWDFLANALCDLNWALEAPPADKADLKSADSQRLNINVPTAAQWILFAGEEIYNTEHDDGLLCHFEEDGLWTGKGGFSYGRWKFWKERAEWVTTLKKRVHTQTIEVAQAIVDEMTRIENADGA